MKVDGKDIRTIWLDENLKVVKIIDQSGRIILTKQLVKDKPIDVGNLPECVAVVQLISNDNIYTKKIIITK